MRSEFATDRRTIILGVARMAEAFGNAFLIVVIPLYIAQDVGGGGTFGLSEALLSGLLLSLPGLLESVGQPFTGRLSDWTGRRKIYILFGLLVIGLTDLGYLLVSTVIGLFAIRLVQGLGGSFTTPATVALINDYASTNNRGVNMGTYTTLRLVGTGLGPVVAGIVVDQGPYRIESSWEVVRLTGFDAAFIIAAIGAFASAGLVALLVVEPDTIQKRSRSATRDVFGGDGSILFDPVIVVAVGALVFGIAIGLVVAIQPQVNTRLDQSPAWFGIQLVAFGVPMAVLGPIFGRASDYLGRRPFLLGGLALLAPTTLAQGFVMTPEMMLMSRFGQGIAAAMAWAPAIALVGDVSTEANAGTKLAILTMSLGLGAGISPLVSGYLIRFGYLVPFLITSLLATIAFGAGMVVLEETHQTDATWVPDHNWL